MHHCTDSYWQCDMSMPCVPYERPQSASAVPPGLCGHALHVCSNDHAFLTAYSCLQELPNSIGSMSRLQTVNLSGCTSLIDLPSSVTDLAELTELDLCGCSSLQALPDSIGECTSLTWLDMNRCKNLFVSLTDQNQISVQHSNKKLSSKQSTQLFGFWH